MISELCRRCSKGGSAVVDINVKHSSEYAVVKKALDSVLAKLPLFIRQWEIETRWIHTYLNRSQRFCIKLNIMFHNIFYFY